MSMNAFPANWKTLLSIQLEKLRYQSLDAYIYALVNGVFDESYYLLLKYTKNLRYFTCCWSRSALLAVFIFPCAAMASGIQSLNYSSHYVNYIAVENPGDTNSGGGGDAVDPFGQGGTICCFSVPEKWHEDLKVVVAYRFDLEETVRRETVSIPPYPDGKSGDIWLIVYADGEVGALVSHYGPSLPQWPGKIKGYPVPSKEYRAKLHNEKITREKAWLYSMEKALKEDTSDLSADQIAGIKESIARKKILIHALEEN